jgi:hypothetical protein
MRRRFGRQPKLSSDSPLEVIVAYAFLRANVPFTIPFYDNHTALNFIDSNGKWTKVKSFGIRRDYRNRYDELLAQVAVLYDDWPSFIVDPCSNSHPNQLVLAAIERQETLQGTLELAEKGIADQRDGRARPSGLSADTELLIPNFDWEISHHFSALEGEERLILNSGFNELYLGTAEQLIRFRLDRCGAELESDSRIALEKSEPKHLIFGTPFLLYIKKRGGERPFFVMWVDNAELLSPF